MKKKVWQLRPMQGGLRTYNQEVVPQAPRGHMPRRMTTLENVPEDAVFRLAFTFNRLTRVQVQRLLDQHMVYVFYVPDPNITWTHVVYPLRAFTTERDCLRFLGLREANRW